MLGVYAVAGAAVIAYLGWLRDTRAHAAAHQADSEAAAAARRKAVVAILGALAIAAVMQCLFSSTYMSSGHSPVASRMPFGTVGPSPLLTQVQKQGYSLALTHYPNESAATQAIDESKLFGALVPATTASSTLYVVASESDVAPLNLTDQFEQAAESVGQPLRVKQYSPTPLPAGDPLRAGPVDHARATAHRRAHGLDDPAECHGHAHRPRGGWRPCSGLPLSGACWSTS